MTKDTVKGFFFKHSRIIILLVLFILFSCITATFWKPTKWGNVINILLQQAPFLLMLSICMILSMILDGIDLSIGSSIALVSCLVAMIINRTYNPWLGIVVGLVLGVIIGLINGVLIAKVKVSPFIATYSMQWILRGFAFVFLGGKQIYDFGPDFLPMFNSSPYTYFIIATVIVIIMMLLLQKTNYGRKVYAIGTNHNAARISGIKTGKIIIITYMISGLIIGIASTMYIANLCGAEPALGANFPMNAIAAALIGGAVFVGGKGKMSNAIVGTLIMLSLTSGMIHLGVPSVWQQFVIGAIIILSIAMERGIQKVSVQNITNG